MSPWHWFIYLGHVIRWQLCISCCFHHPPPARVALLSPASTVLYLGWSLLLLATQIRLLMQTLDVELAAHPQTEQNILSANLFPPVMVWVLILFSVDGLESPWTVSRPMESRIIKHETYIYIHILYVYCMCVWDIVMNTIWCEYVLYCFQAFFRTFFTITRYFAVAKHQVFVHLWGTTLQGPHIKKCILTSGVRINPVQHGEYHGYWCPTSLRHQVISSHNVYYVE